MPKEWGEGDDVVAAGGNCPWDGCGALAVAYRLALKHARARAAPWKFSCPRCGLEFEIPDDELIFQSVPKNWLLAKSYPK